MRDPSKGYKDTLNLPFTKFPMKANLPKREPETLRDWEQEKIYFKILDKRKNAPLFILHDGPPYSNGHLHLGHTLNKILKDILIKYKALSGYKTPFIPGWDNHGMPIENMVTRTDPELKGMLKDPSKLRIPEIRLKLRQKCRTFADKWVKTQKREFIRLGIFADWDNAYLTMSPYYEGTELDFFAELVEKGYVYRSRMPIHWCPTCQTALAMAEIQYKDKQSPSLWFWFGLKEDPKGVFKNSSDLRALVWTTTPWTIISNVALAFHPEVKYLVIEFKGNRYLLAKPRFEEIKEHLKWTEAKILFDVPGKELEGLVFEHPFMDRESLAILADFVTMEEGTGIVHIAPGHGREDFQIGREYNLPVISPVDERGRFTKEAGREFLGLDIESASKKVTKILEERGNLILSEKIVHSYPHCWRCGTPLIFRATHQWFLSVDHENLRNRAIFALKGTNWIPKEGKERLSVSVSERPDWVLSRQRGWGVNLPALYCKSCGKPILDPVIIRKVSEFFKKGNSDKWITEPVESFLPDGYKCPHCGGTEFEKESDVLDVWFDSGATSLVVLSKRNGLRWPSDVYLEGVDQYRGWFNASLMASIALKKQPPFKTTIVHGWVVDQEGKAMHKSLGNVVSPSEITEKYGAEILRLWVASSDYTQDVRLGPEILERLVEAYRKIRNTIRFMLANLHNYNVAKHKENSNHLRPIDQFILLRLEELKKDVSSKYESYEFHKAYSSLYKFVVVDLSSLYLDCIKDRLYTWGKNSKSRKGAQFTLYETLKTLLVLYSPVLSFTTDEAWKYLPGDKEESVFLSDWPKPSGEKPNLNLKRDFEVLLGTRELVYLGLEETRRKGTIKDRLEAKVILVPKEKEVKEILKKYERELPEFYIVSQVEISDKKPDIVVEKENESLWIGILHAQGKKCSRCWMWHEDVGKDAEYTDLCPKCLEVIREGFYDPAV